MIACDAAAKGRNVGWFTPDYKIQAEAFHEVADVLDPVKRSSSRIEGVFRTTTGGRIDFWTLENERAGRSRKYHWALVDEAAFTKRNMAQVWKTAILPSLWDYQGRAILGSTPNGKDPENFFYSACEGLDTDLGSFVSHWAPSWTNPHVPERRPAETEFEHAVRSAAHWAKVEADSHPLVFQQETRAEFVDWSGAAFFELGRMLVDGHALPYPTRTGTVFATVDTATKTGKEHDTTAVCYWAFDLVDQTRPLVLLDWDAVKISVYYLSLKKKFVFERLDVLAREVGARLPSLGAFIEDKNSGSVLVQQARRRGWPAQGLDSKFTAMGKSERALAVASHVYQGKLGLSHVAYDKETTVKGKHLNHLVSQVVGFRVGVELPGANDDLLDCFTYGLLVALGLPIALT